MAQNRSMLFQLDVITVEHFSEILKLHGPSQTPARPGRSKLLGTQSWLFYQIKDHRAC